MRLKHLIIRFALSLTLLLAVPPLIWSAEPSEEEESKPETSSEKPAEEKPKKDEKFKPYDEIITEDAVTDAGLFYTHKIDDKLFFEIPASELLKPMLWVTQVAQTQAGYTYAGQPVGDRVVRWVRKDDDILLRDVTYRIRADVDGPIRKAVEATSLEPVIAKFPIKAWGKDRAPVIDVTDLFLGDLPEFTAKRTINAQGADKSRSFLDSINAFPKNIETKVLMTYKLSDDRGAVSTLLHHSMVLLPETPMEPRRHDDRVGYFNITFEDYATPEHRVRQERYITRWRLEKKDPSAEVSEPKQPIVFYVGRGVPDRWRPWVKKGIEAWQPAFEAAGFKTAIIAKEPPDPRDDPEWDAEDARYSVIRWLPSTIENAYGPHVHDPRTGEIIEADIRMYHNVLKLVRDWYFVQVSPLDERARKLPLPDELMGELLAFVVSHEVGHSLGLPHNMKASSSYSVAQLRDPEFTKKNGPSPSIMDYARFNYVAQPGDGTALIPQIGPYDFFAIEWGYKQFDSKLSDEEEEAELEKIAARQVENPVLRFGAPNAREDPSAQTEDLGANPVDATELGLKNILRVATNLVNATSVKGTDYLELRNMYEELLNQRNRELGHVVNLVGGMIQNNLWFGDADHRYEPVEKPQQVKAVEFLNEHAFHVPEELISPDILLRLEASGASERMLGAQRQILENLLYRPRLERMAELRQRLEADESYSPAAMLEDLREGLWEELAEKSGEITINLYRRNLQRAHVDTLTNYAGETEPSEISALARGELRKLLAALNGEQSADAETQLHIDDLEARIDHFLNPNGDK